KPFRLDGFDGVGGAWKMPSETFDARYGRWGDHQLEGRVVPFGEGVGFPSEPSPRHRLEHQRDTINTISLKKPFGRGTKCNGRVGKRKKIGGNDRRPSVIRRVCGFATEPEGLPRQQYRLRYRKRRYSYRVAGS